MSYQLIERLFDADDPPWRNQSEFAMLLALAYYTNSKQGFAWPSRARLAKLLRMKPRSVTRLLRELERRGLVETIPGRGKRQSLYRLVFHRGDPSVTSIRAEVTAASPGDDPTVSTGDPSVASEVPLRSPDLYVPGIDQEVPSALAARDTHSAEENDSLAWRRSLLADTKARIEAARRAVDA
jgi:hypothetical protein